METTVVILKPDCVEKKLIGEVIRRLETGGFSVRACKMMFLSTDILRDHYSHLVDKPFFPELVGFMQATPVVALAVEAPNAIVRIRDLVGPTDSTKAPKGTIRGDLGDDKMRNIVHASDSNESAATELRRFFSSDEIFTAATTR